MTKTCAPQVTCLLSNYTTASCLIKLIQGLAAESETNMCRIIYACLTSWLLGNRHLYSNQLTALPDNLLDGLTSIQTLYVARDATIGAYLSGD